MAGLALSVTATPSADELGTIAGNLTAFNESDAGPAERLPLAIIVREGDAIVGGISGYTGWGWLYVQLLWVDASQRGQGLAGRMLAAAEGEAKARGCHGAYIDTFNPVALSAYRRAGYVPFGSLADFPRGRTRTFLQKPL